MPLKVTLMLSRLFWLSQITLLSSSLGVLFAFEHFMRRDPYSVNQTRQSQVYSNSTAAVLTPGRQMVMPSFFFKKRVLRFNDSNFVCEFFFLFHFNLLTKLPWYVMRAVLG